MYEVNMETPAEDQPLSKDEEGIVVRKLTEIWNNGERALSESRAKKKDLVKAYNAQHLVRPDKGRSDAYLPMVYNAIEIAHARLDGALLPTEEEVFTILGETEDDAKACDIIRDYLKSLIKSNDGYDVISDAIKEALFGGEAVVKVTMKKNTAVATQTTTQPVFDTDGNPMMDTLGRPMTEQVAQQVEELNFYGCVFELIQPEDFIMYPVTGSSERATMAHRVYRYYDELLEGEQLGLYQNVSDIPYDPQQDESSYSSNGELIDAHKRGLCLKEYWISRINIKGRIYKNMVATIVDDKYLIRFNNNPLDYGLKPFAHVSLIKNYTTEGGLQNTGHGICHRAFELQRIMNMIANQVLDESRSKLFGMWKYKDDSVFNPATFVFRPNGLVKMKDPATNLLPLNNPIGNLSFGINEMEYFENQFQTTTGIPKFLHGVQDGNPRDTATAKRLAAEGSDVRFRKLGQTLNKILKDVLRITYSITRQVALNDPLLLEDIARRTQMTRQRVLNPLTQQLEWQEVPIQIAMEKVKQMPTLKNIDIDVVGFENVLRKQEKAIAMERFFQGLAQFATMPPEVRDWIKDESIDAYARYLGIDGDLIRTEMERIQAQQQRMIAMAKQAASTPALPAAQ